MKTKICPKNQPHTTAFTLIEIILVLSIIALLLGVGIANLGNIGGDAKIVKARTDISALQTGLASYLHDAGRYPTQEQGLGALRRAPVTPPISRSWGGPYMSRMPLDPWDQPYQYRNPGTHNPGQPDIFSMGEDGIAGNEDDIYPKAGAGDDAY